MNVDFPDDPLAALQQHVDLIRWWQRNPYAPIIAEGYKSLLKVRSSAGRPLANPVFHYLTTFLDEADTYFMRANIVDTLWGKVGDEEMDEALTPDLLPTPHGYVWLENPIYATDIRGAMCSIRVIAWFSNPEAVVVTYFADKHDELDEINQQVKQKDPDLYQNDPRTPLFHIDTVPWGSTKYFGGGSFQEWKEEEGIEQLVEDYNRQHANHTPLTLDNMEVFQQSVEDVNVLHQFVFAMWDFMIEQIPAPQSPNRQMKRRLMREGSRHLEVRVIALRKQQAAYRSPEEREAGEVIIWTKRWRSREHSRRGHWRRKFDKAGNVIGQTWIKAAPKVKGSVKGPKNMPLIEKDTVYDVKR